jgi:hypothetical protein
MTASESIPHPELLEIYDEDGLTLAATMPFSTSAEAFRDAQMIVDNKVERPRK